MTDVLTPLPIDVVSIQSQVVYGCVGNNAAIPTLQKLGLSVAAVPTVVFSNTPHYPTIHGGAIPADWFAGYLRGLRERQALAHTRAVLVGYMGGPQQAEILSGWLREIAADLPSIQIFIDPVIGDYDSGIYVKPGMVQAYQQQLLPLAHGMTPNCFELQSLTGCALSGLDSVIAAAKTLLQGKTQWVVVTSAAPDAASAAEMRVVLVSRAGVEVLSHPRIDATPKGTGDMFSATLTGYLLAGHSLAEAAQSACDNVMAALERTQRLGSNELVLTER
ncbi:pyridoxine/pyridoxal/pyridoxamine kinase [Affinibrenneria salicis]|uniref:pyridoxal kinase n=1 Tax=Affinibrenneria salicis TaxID=2590031 RepID=A0A5J5FYV9_9GAMM|nr:pyridoxine/pyridoxal/pyridoxamine kinase [Affinibrenneria salicis]KAA8998950.1 pyridoxine/pyridoxal/pyridoxamine kinase [Affinibrenneria salicis]